MLIHFIKHKDIENLMQVFAVLTEKGWVVPEWVMDLYYSAKN